MHSYREPFTETKAFTGSLAYVHDLSKAEDREECASSSHDVNNINYSNTPRTSNSYENHSSKRHNLSSLTLPNNYLTATTNNFFSSSSLVPKTEQESSSLLSSSLFNAPVNTIWSNKKNKKTSLSEKNANSSFFTAPSCPYSNTTSPAKANITSFLKRSLHSESKEPSSQLLSTSLTHKNFVVNQLEKNATISTCNNSNSNSNSNSNNSVNVKTNNLRKSKEQMCGNNEKDAEKLTSKHKERNNIKHSERVLRKHEAKYGLTLHPCLLQGGCLSEIHHTLKEEENNYIHKNNNIDNNNYSKNNKSHCHSREHCHESVNELNSKHNTNTHVINNSCKQWCENVSHYSKSIQNYIKAHCPHLHIPSVCCVEKMEKGICTKYYLSECPWHHGDVVNYRSSEMHYEVLFAKVDESNYSQELSNDEHSSTCENVQHLHLNKISTRLRNNVKNISTLLNLFIDLVAITIESSNSFDDNIPYINSTSGSNSNKKNYESVENFNEQKE